MVDEGVALAAGIEAGQDFNLTVLTFPNSQPPELRLSVLKNECAFESPAGCEDGFRNP